MLAFLLCFWIDFRSKTLSSDCFLLARVTGVSDLLQRSRWDDQYRYFSYWSAIDVLSAHEVAGDEVSVSPISRNHPRVVFLLNFGIAPLTFLVNCGSDKPSKS